MRKLLLTVCFMIFAMAQLPTAWAESDLIDGRQCLICHKPMKQTYQQSAHARAFAGNEALGCQSCHGGGAAHKEVADQDNAKGPWKIESFKKTSATSEEKNRPCLTCHENKTHANWRGSPHETGGVACADCHTLHKGRDTIRQDVCYTCHKEQRAQFNRAFHLPIKEGKITCSNCHNSHGSSGPKLLVKNTVNETCYSCHAEKRGPFLWEHPPATDDCMNCHTPHGSVNAAMLKTRPPYLCAQCHIAGGHSGTGIRSGNDLGSGVVTGGAATAAPQMVGSSCMNCHTQIHGSNHPSGARFVR